MAALRPLRLGEAEPPPLSGGAFGWSEGAQIQNEPKGARQSGCLSVFLCCREGIQRSRRSCGSGCANCTSNRAFAQKTTLNKLEFTDTDVYFVISKYLSLNGVPCVLEMFSKLKDGRWIDADGSVIYDTRADADEIENHADREEFREAMESGEGKSTRYSATLMKKTTYFARRLSD